MSEARHPRLLETGFENNTTYGSWMSWLEQELTNKGLRMVTLINLNNNTTRMSIVRSVEPKETDCFPDEIATIVVFFVPKNPVHEFTDIGVYFNDEALKSATLEQQLACNILQYLHPKALVGSKFQPQGSIEHLITQYHGDYSDFFSLLTGQQE